MKRVALIGGVVLLMGGWFVAALPLGITGHMTGHMTVVAFAAPLIAIGIAGGRADPAERWPAGVTPLAMSLVELAVVWGWHLPRLRAIADGSAAGLAAEQASFLAAGLLLWSAVLGTRHGGAERRAAGAGALFLTSMHMTLLGALIGLAPRPLYAPATHGHGLDALADQQLGGVAMLMLGAASYLAGGLAMLAGLLRQRRSAA